MLQNPRPATKVLSKSSYRDGDGSPIQNFILMKLQKKESDALLAKLEFVRMNVQHMIHEAGDAIKSAYFINSGMISVLAVQPDGKSVEIGIIGKEGFVGLPLLVGYSSSPTRVVAQADTTAYRLDGETLRRTIHQYPQLAQQLHRFEQQRAMQTAQTQHAIDCTKSKSDSARWLLMTQDRIQTRQLPLTPEFLGRCWALGDPASPLPQGLCKRPV